MQIFGFNKLTLLDYPGHLAATIFLGGCNLRCPFCHNASLVTKLPTQTPIHIDDIMDHLNKRRGVLEGVCITGGEPTIYQDLPELIKMIKSLDYNIKLDTNGTNPAMLKSLVKDKLIDYVAMDIKNSPDKYAITAGISDIQIELVNESIAFLLSSDINYEFRTTIVKEYHTKEDILAIGQWIKGAKAYYLQGFIDSGDIILPGLHEHTKETLQEFETLLKAYVQQVSLRGIE